MSSDPSKPAADLCKHCGALVGIGLPALHINVCDTCRAEKYCKKCGTYVAFTSDWTLWPWPDGNYCSPCNDEKLETEEYP